MAKTKKPSESKGDSIDSMMNSIADKLKSKKKNIGSFSFSTGKSDRVKDFISTGCSTLDLAISNRQNGGIPVGKVTEISGLESSGKSLLCAHISKNTQSRGGFVLYFDTERALDESFFEAVGVEFNGSFMRSKNRAIEDILNGIEETIEDVRSVSAEVPLTIIIDSIAGATTKISYESDGFDLKGYNTAKAILLSNYLGDICELCDDENVTLIMTNQLRYNMNVTNPYQDKFKTSGGKALDFYPSVRLRAKSKSKIKSKINGVEEIIGIASSIEVHKNRLGPPKRTVDFDIYFDSGIDDVGGLYTLMKKYKVVKVSGGWSSYVDKDSGEVHKWQGSTGLNDLWNKQDGLRDKMVGDLHSVYIRKYKNDVIHDVDDVIKEEVSED